VTGPAIEPADLPPLDAVLLTHDHHADNLDDAGRALLPSAPVVVTTTSGATRLGGTARGLRPWQTTVLEAPGRPGLEVTATPARHGPPLSRPVAGDVVGFALRWEGQRDGVLWISGDTVLFGGLRQVAERLRVDTAVLHLGGVRFPVTGPLRYSMTGRQAVELCRLLGPRTVVPVHYEGWSHFAQGRAGLERDLARAPEVQRTVRWLPIGEAVELAPV
jgi:L-ascorbate metabolism protein UlaG (beta-lactamase superfamily)